jgi:hypothetical protein
MDLLYTQTKILDYHWLSLDFQADHNSRFDRVVSILEHDNTLDFIKQFKNNITTVVIGSSWPKDAILNPTPRE